MNTEEELVLLLGDYDKLALAIAKVLSEPHALDNIRIATRTFHQNEGRYPREIHSVLVTYLDNCRRQELFGNMSKGGD